MTSRKGGGYIEKRGYDENKSNVVEVAELFRSGLGKNEGEAEILWDHLEVVGKYLMMCWSFLNVCSLRREQDGKVSTRQAKAFRLPHREG